MRRREAAKRPPDREEFGGQPLDELQSGAFITLNIDGEWQIAELTADARVQGGKLHVEADVNGAPVTRDLSAKAAASIEHIQLHTGLNGHQREGGHDYVIHSPTLDRGGHVVYTVEDATTHEINEAVPQELLLTWQRVKVVEGQVRDLHKQLVDSVGGVRAEEREKLHKLREPIEKLLNEIAMLPAHEEMSAADRAEVKKINRRFLEWQTRAEQELKKFADAVDEGLIPPLTPTAPTWAEHKQTAAEVEVEKKRHEKRVEWAKEQKAAIEKDILAEIDRQKELDLDPIRKKKQKEYDDKKKRYDDAVDQYDKETQVWEAAGRPKGSKPTYPGIKEPPPYDSNDERLPDRRAQAIEKDVRDNFYTGVYPNINTSTEFGRELKAAIDTKRCAEAAGYYDHTKVSGGDFAGSMRDKKNAELVVGMLASWQVEEFKVKEQKFARGAEVFDFDAETEKAFAEVKALQEEIKTSLGGAAPKRDTKQMLDDIQGVLDDSMDRRDGLATLDAARKFLAKSLLKEADLRQEREALVIAVRDELREIRLRWQERRGKETKKDVDESVKKDLAEKSKEKAELKKEKSIIDIPEARLREILLDAKLPEVKAAAQILYEGVLQSGASGKIKTEALTAFQNLFTDAPANPAFLTELRRYGIADWEEFKELWDTKLVEQVARTMALHAEATINKKVAERLTTWEQTKKLKWQIAARVGISVALIGGAGVAAAATFGLAGIGGAAAVLGGGAISGGIRGWINRKIFGSETMEEQTQTLMDELREDIKGRVVAEALEEQFGAGASGNLTIATDNIEGLPSFSAILAQTLREATAEKMKVGKVELAGNARAVYEEALRHLETKDPNDTERLELAQAISRIHGNGDRMTAEAEAEIKAKAPKAFDVLENWVQSYSGKKGIAMAAGSGALAAGALLLDNEWARGVIGGVMGAYTGRELGTAWFEGRETRAAREAVLERMRMVRFYTEEIQAGRVLSNSAREDFRNDLLSTKRLLHGNASPEELSIFVTIKGGQATVDMNLRKQMESMTRDAERTGVLFENHEDRANFEKVLEAMNTHGEALEAEYEETFGRKAGRWLKKKGTRWGGALVGAALGGATAIGLGYIARPVTGFIGEKVRAGLGLSESASVTTTGEAGEKAVATAAATEAAAETKASGAADVAIGEAAPATPAEETMTPPEVEAPKGPTFGEANLVHGRGFGFEGKGEGITNPIIRDLEAKPEHLQSYKGIPQIDKLLVKHPDGAGLSLDEQKLAAKVIYERDFGKQYIWVKNPDKIAVVFDEGRFKLGAVGGGRVEEHLGTPRIEKGSVVDVAPEAKSTPIVELHATGPKGEGVDLMRMEGSDGPVLTATGEEVFVNPNDATTSETIVRAYDARGNFLGLLTESKGGVATISETGIDRSLDQFKNLTVNGHSHAPLPEGGGEGEIEEVKIKVDDLKKDLPAAAKVDLSAAAKAESGGAAAATAAPAIEAKPIGAGEAVTTPVEKPVTAPAIEAGAEPPPKLFDAAADLYKDLLVDAQSVKDALLTGIRGKIFSTPASIEAGDKYLNLGLAKSSEQFMADVANRLEGMTPEQLTNARVVELLGTENVTAKQLLAALKQNILESLPPGADVLFKQADASGFTLSQMDNSVVRIINPATQESMIVRAPGFSFVKGEGETLLAVNEKTAESFIINPDFSGGETKLVFEAKKVDVEVE